MSTERAPRNRTLSCDEDEISRLAQSLRRLTSPVAADALEGEVVNQDIFEAAAFLPRCFADLMIIDPPYNISKDFNGHLFKEKEKGEYCSWFESVLDAVIPVLRPAGTVYVCSDWKTSMLVGPILEKRLCVRNRITWEREKGRGAKSNWKNNTEDIWFCTASAEFHFDVDAVKLKRKVIAPYRDDEGKPKDWDESDDGNYRLTHPSNIWSDITIPFWSMPENTDHPTQKPEKLIAKLILASTAKGGLVFDPFLGSGTTAVVAKKLGRRFLGVELNTEYCCWAQKRLEAADFDSSIQGYADGVFWERNSFSDQKEKGRHAARVDSESHHDLFK
jgi:site-specific DNA-methyltransferase (adenine-specific)